MLGPTPINAGAFVTVDIETTGCRPGTSSVIEIGAVRIEHGEISARFATLVRSDEVIPPAIARLTGITDEMVASAPPIGEAIASFCEFAHGAVLIAHNHRFDMSFLDFEAERTFGEPFARPILDTLSLARRLHPELLRHNLRDLAAFYGTDSAPNHRALPDALATAEVFLKMVPEFESSGLVTAADVARLCGVAQQSRLARKLALATTIPDTPGVYLFRDEAGQVIFIGKAKGLRTRVRNHFYAPDDTTAPTPASEVAAIDYFDLVSPLDAALLEVRLQDRYSPLFNRDGHQQRQPLYLHVDTTSEYPSVRPTHRRLRSGELLGPLSNEWAAATVAEALSEYFGLRRCRCPLEECEGCEHERQSRHLCTGPEVFAADREGYVSGVRAALAVFNGRDAEFREVLRLMQERSARSERFEDAAYYRDAIRALDRTLSALAVARRASAEPVSVIIEGDLNAVAVLVLVRGWLFTTLRFARAEIEDGTYVRLLSCALDRALRASARNLRVTPRELRDMAIIDAYRQQQGPATVVVSGDGAAATREVAAVIRRLMRVARRRHGAV